MTEPLKVQTHIWLWQRKLYETINNLINVSKGVSIWLKKGLGKGLNSLFNEEDIEEVTSDITKSSEGDIKKVRMSLIEPNKKQPRRHFDEEK